jgi:hypothetical protein
MGGAVTLAVLVALTVGAQGAAAQEGTTYENGEVCLAAYSPGATCTANDIRIASITPNITEVCTAAGDQATALFSVWLVTGATERYDVSFFVAKDGGSAKTGTSCYHDFLQPGRTTGGWDLLGGYGFFKELETTAPDVCADILQADGDTYYTFQTPVTITCVDNDNNGVVDPVSTCTGWHNVAKYDCLEVTDAGLDAPSKCTCAAMPTNPTIKIYRGYDWGDLPNPYPTDKDGGGPQHSIQDLNNDGAPDTVGGVPGVWLGPTVDYSPSGESDGIPSALAKGDDTAYLNDEDGITVPATPPWSLGINGGRITVSVNSSDGTCTNCRLGFWFDWNNDGDLDDPGESYNVPISYGSNQTVNFDIPEPTVGSKVYLRNVYARFRLYDQYAGSPSPIGLVLNGEVEDYFFQNNPTAVELLSFTATGTKGAIVLDWETATEVNNAGFNLYRGTRADRPRTKLNAELIPSNVYPGSPIGTRYQYTDTALKPRVTYYYWLEDVDIYGVATLHGPARATAR